MKYTSMTKKELRLMAGCSVNTFTVWMKRLAPGIPDYRPSQRLLNPAQVKYIMEALCLDST